MDGGARAKELGKRSRGEGAEKSVISAKLVSVLAINARVPGSNPTVDGYFSTSLIAL